MKKVLRTASGWKEDERICCRKVYNEEILHLYLLPNVIRKITLKGIEWSGHVAHMEGREKCIEDLGRKEIQ